MQSLSLQGEGCSFFCTLVCFRFERDIFSYMGAGPWIFKRYLLLLFYLNLLDMSRASIVKDVLTNLCVPILRL
jgi:hypothetical protein